MSRIHFLRILGLLALSLPASAVYQHHRVVVFQSDPSVIGADRKPLVLALRFYGEVTRTRQLRGEYTQLGIQEPSIMFTGTGPEAQASVLDALATRYATMEDLHRAAALHSLVIAEKTFQFGAMALQRTKAAAQKIDGALGALVDGALGRFEDVRTRKPFTVNVRTLTGEQNAFCDSWNRTLNFGSFYDTTSRANIHTGCATGVVSHEGGHALLNLLTDFLDGQDGHAAGAHESFGDLIQMMVTLQQPEARARVIYQAGGDLHKAGLLTEMAKQFGSAFGLKTGLRNADDDFRLPDSKVLPGYEGRPRLKATTLEAHDASMVLTGALFDCLARVYDEAVRQNPSLDLERQLYDGAAVPIGQLFMLSILKSVYTYSVRTDRGTTVRVNDVFYPNIAYWMEQYALANIVGATKSWAPIIRDEFMRREVPLDPRNPLQITGSGLAGARAQARLLSVHGSDRSLQLLFGSGASRDQPPAEVDAQRSPAPTELYGALSQSAEALRRAADDLERIVGTLKEAGAPSAARTLSPYAAHSSY